MKTSLSKSKESKVVAEEFKEDEKTLEVGSSAEPGVDDVRVEINEAIITAYTLGPKPKDENLRNSMREQVAKDQIRVLPKNLSTEMKVGETSLKLSPGHSKLVQDSMDESLCVSKEQTTGRND